MATTRTHAQLLALVQSHIAKHGTQRAAAKSLGISQSLLNDIQHGRRGFGPKLLRALGHTEEIRYRKITA